MPNIATFITEGKFSLMGTLIVHWFLSRTTWTKFCRLKRDMLTCAPPKFRKRSISKPFQDSFLKTKLTRLVLFQGTTIRPAGPSQNLPHMESNWREWIAILVLGWCLNLVCNTISFGRRINPNNEEDHLVVENWPICPAVRRKPEIWRKSS